MPIYICQLNNNTTVEVNAPNEQAAKDHLGHKLVAYRHGGASVIAVKEKQSE